MAQHWDVDPVSGDYLQSGGQPVQTDSLRIPTFYRWRTKRKLWLYAPDDQYGSDFHTLRRNLTSDNDVSIIERLGANALQPMVDDGRARVIDVEVKKRDRHGLCLGAKITEARGEVEQFELTPIGDR